MAFYTSYESEDKKEFAYVIKEQIIHLANHDAYFCGYIIDNNFHLTTNHHPIFNNNNFMPCQYTFHSDKKVCQLKIYVVLQNIFGYYYKYEMSYSPLPIKKNYYELHFTNIGFPKKLSVLKIKQFYSAINKQYIRQKDNTTPDKSLDW